MKKIVVSMMIGFLTLFSACTQESNKENILTIIAETAALEKQFEKYRSDINELEKEENKLYTQLIHLEENDEQTAKELSKKAIANLAEQVNLLELEKEAIIKAKNEFTDIKSLIDVLPEEEKEVVKGIYETMIKRYETYDLIYKLSLELNDLTHQFYVKFQDREVATDLFSQISDANDMYVDMTEAQKQFNKYTITYDSLTTEFVEK